MTIEDAIQAAEEAGLPPRVAPKLEGKTLDELRADARQLKEFMGPATPPKPTPKVPLPDLHGGARDSSSAEAGTGWFPNLNPRG